VILLFTGKAGKEYGYLDDWSDDGTYRYFGEGQTGNMTMTRGNLAILDHAKNGKTLHLFHSVGGGFVRYLGEMTCAGSETVSGIPDAKGGLRNAIVFHLLPDSDLQRNLDAEKPADSKGTSVPRGWYWEAPLSELRSAALQGPPRNSSPSVAKRNLYHRSESVKVYVQRRSLGNCEGCGNKAPFLTKSGRPYLEPHHTQRLSDGGPDNPRCVVAVCPTCHRRAHYSEDAETYNAKLKDIANKLESDR
jgi:5-methylcytosine-specific restriction protein A